MSLPGWYQQRPGSPAALGSCSWSPRRGRDLALAVGSIVSSGLGAGDSRASSGMISGRSPQLGIFSPGWWMGFLMLRNLAQGRFKIFGRGACAFQVQQAVGEVPFASSIET